MYCCRTYGYYRGLVAPVTGKTIKKPAVKTATKEELEAAEAQRAARILALGQELSELEQIEHLSKDDLIVIEQNGTSYKMRYG